MYSTGSLEDLDLPGILIDKFASPSNDEMQLSAAIGGMTSATGTTNYGMATTASTIANVNVNMNRTAAAIGTDRDLGQSMAIPIMREKGMSPHVNYHQQARHQHHPNPNSQSQVKSSQRGIPSHTVGGSLYTRTPVPLMPSPILVTNQNGNDLVFPQSCPDAFSQSDASGSMVATAATAASSYGSPVNETLRIPKFHLHYSESPKSIADSMFSFRATTLQSSQEQQSEKHKRRKENHNAVERRRRDHINEMIGRMAALVPSCTGYNTDSMNAMTIDIGNSSLNNTPATGSAGGRPNKGEILQKAVEYMMFQKALLEAQAMRLTKVDPEWSPPLLFQPVISEHRDDQSEMPDFSE